MHKEEAIGVITLTEGTTRELKGVAFTDILHGRYKKYNTYDLCLCIVSPPTKDIEDTERHK